MRIAIVVQGRFHAFDMARELLALGHDVRLLTNYPRAAVARFGVPPQYVESLVSHALAARAANKIGRLLGRDKIGEAFLHRGFSRWAAARLRRHPVDVSHCFSGVAEEVLRDPVRSQRIRSVLRGSSHIRLQRRILDDEEVRAGRAVDKPSDWMVAREEREYAAADLIVVLSQFAKDSFLAQGVPASKLVVFPLGVEPTMFQARPEDVAARRERILSNRKLVVLTVGSFSLRKGAFDYEALARRMAGMDFVFRGDVGMDATFLQARAGDAITFRPRVAEDALYEDYRAADLFYFPTLEDGYAAVLLQAAAAGLPILATTNCGAADFLTEGQDGWIVPIRRPDLAMDRLSWCDRNREALAGIADAAARPKPVRHWSARVDALVQTYQTALDNVV
jgi:glycosyltransferase involved in cell wall biosynthesis